MEEPSGDQGVRRGQHTNQSILGGTQGNFGVPAPGNGQATQVGKVQFVGLEIGDDGVNLFGDLLQLGQSSPVLDVGLIHLSISVLVAFVGALSSNTGRWVPTM